MRQRIFSGVALAAFYLFAHQTGAFGAQIHGCNSCVRAAAFTYQAPLQIVGGYYMPAEALQQRAAQQLQMEASPDLAAFRDFQRFRQYEQWQAGQQEQPAAQPENSSMSSGHTSPPTAPFEQPAPPVTDTPPTAPAGGGPLPPPAPGAPSPWGAKYPTLMAKCSKCHSGAEPDGDFILDGTGDLQSPHLAAKRDAVMREIVNERMPRKAGTEECVPLSDEEMGAVIAELWLE